MVSVRGWLCISVAVIGRMVGLSLCVVRFDLSIGFILISNFIDRDPHRGSYTQNAAAYTTARKTADDQEKNITRNWTALVLCHDHLSTNQSH